MKDGTLDNAEVRDLALDLTRALLACLRRFEPDYQLFNLPLVTMDGSVLDGHIPAKTPRPAARPQPAAGAASQSSHHPA